MTSIVSIVGAVALLLSITGCGTRAKLATIPTVVFIGDSITYNWADGEFGSEFAQHPAWVEKGVTGQNSNQILARFSSDVVALHPDIVHILTGTNDVFPGWQGPCITSEVPKVFLNRINSCQNVEAMVALAQAAGIKVILGTIPPWGPGSLPEGADPTASRFQRIAAWNAWLVQYAAANHLALADYHLVLQAANGDQYITTYTVDGVHPSAAGFAVMTPVVEQAITATCCNAATKTAGHAD